MAYGIELNMAVTYDENGSVDGGIHVTDSEGLDFSTQSTGASMDEMIESLMCDALDQLATAKMSPIDRKIAELEEQLEELYAQKENDEFGLEDEGEKEDCHGCGKCCDEDNDLEEIDHEEFSKMIDDILAEFPKFESTWKHIGLK